MITGLATKIGRAMHDIQYDAVHDEIVMTNPFAQAVLTFRGDANGEEPPIRILQGPSTQMMDPDHVVVDPVHDELFVFEAEFILVFPRTAQGDAAPIRVIRGPDTRIKGGRTLAVDPVRNLLVATVTIPETRGYGLVVFNRTDNGNVKPRAVIAGPKTGINSAVDQIQINPTKGWIVVNLPGGGRREEGQEPREQESRESRGGGRGSGGTQIGVWSVDDNGDIPPVWLLGAPNNGMQGRRLTLNPKGKEIITGGGTQMQMFSFPEIF